jgi:hypothetical protein
MRIGMRVRSQRKQAAKDEKRRRHRNAVECVRQATEKALQALQAETEERIKRALDDERKQGTIS